MTDKDDDLPSLHSLSQKIDQAKGGAADDSSKKEDPHQGSRDGWRAISDLVAGMAVGGFLGYYADDFFDTRPAFLIIGILLGMAGGIMNIYRASMRESRLADQDTTSRGDDK